MTRAELNQHVANGTITPRQADALFLHDIKRMSIRQIALGLGISHTTVADRITRARQKINHAERKTA